MTASIGRDVRRNELSSDIDVRRAIVDRHHLSPYSDDDDKDSTHGIRSSDGTLFKDLLHSFFREESSSISVLRS
jgi:hypothetical protein